MPYIFGKLWHLAIIWAIRKAFQCILQGVRILLANHTRISPTSENDSYIPQSMAVYMQCSVQCAVCTVTSLVYIVCLQNMSVYAASSGNFQIMGMFFFHSLPVPKLWKRIFFISFPFQNLPFYSLESKRELKYCERYQTSNIFSFLYISYNNLYNEEVNWAKEFRSEWLKRQDILLSFVANS